MRKKEISVVIVEDEFLIALDLKGMCEDLGANVVGVASKEAEALAMIEAKNPDYVLMDVRLQGKRDGVDIANHIHAQTPEMRVVFITGSNEPPTLARINDDNPYRILIKPISQSDLREAFGL